METSWASENDLRPRIDAEYYGRAFVEAECRLSANVKTLPFRKLWRNANRIYIGIAGFESVEDPSQYTPYLRPADISDDGWINYRKLPWCKKEWLIDHEKNGCALPGDLIIEVKGYTRKVAIVSSDIPDRCVVSGSSYRIQLKPDFDSHYVFCYLLSPTGQTLKRRLVSNTGISYIDPDSFKSYDIPIPRDDIQHAIGHKVRAAERLRSASALAQSAINAWLAGCLPAWEEPGEQLAVMPTFNRNINTERLDPWYNHLQFQQLDAALLASHSLVPLSSVGTSVSERWSGTSGEIEYIEIGEFDLAQGTVHGKVISAAGAPSRAQIAARSGDLAVSLVRPNRKNIVFIQGTGKRQIVVTSGCEVLRFADEATAALYSVVLRHNAITHQIMRWNTGTSYPAIEQLHADRVLVPAIPDDKKSKLLKAARLAVTGVERSKDLAQSAVVDVENMIDGKLDEAACLAEGRKLAEEFGLEVP